jgi:hypothetical protein
MVNGMVICLATLGWIFLTSNEAIEQARRHRRRRSPFHLASAVAAPVACAAPPYQDYSRYTHEPASVSVYLNVKGGLGSPS